jgi:mono/diheme cytochrome c family protein
MARPAVAMLAALATAPAARGADTSQPDAGLVARGEYLVTLGDCAACHTANGQPKFSGGRYMPTPFGPISTANITPDKETGIGTWTDDQFYRLFHNGIGQHGEYIYPVMPYPWYTKVTRDDVLAIKAYLFSLAPVHHPRPPNHLAFPFNVREGLARSSRTRPSRRRSTAAPISSKASRIAASAITAATCWATRRKRMPCRAVRSSNGMRRTSPRTSRPASGDSATRTSSPTSRPERTRRWAWSPDRWARQCMKAWASSPTRICTTSCCI